MPPLLWIGLCLESGSNKSGILSAIATLTSSRGLEKHPLEEALKAIRQTQTDVESDDDDVQGAGDDVRDQRQRAAKGRKLALETKLTSL